MRAAGICALVLLIALHAVAASAAIELSDAQPVCAKPVQLTALDNATPLVNVELGVNYYPNSRVFKEPFLIGTTDEQGQVSWTPQHPGLASIGRLVRSETGALNLIDAKTISVRFAAFPFSGLLVFLIAFVLLFGGITFSTWKIISYKDPVDPAPST